MTIYQNILTAVDFSDNTNKIIQHSAALAQQLEANLSILHVVDFSPSSDIERVLPPLDSPENKRIIEAKEQLNMILEREALSSGLRSIVVAGQPKVEILRVAEKENIDLIVIGAHGRHGFANLLLGSTENRILDQATCNVLVVH